MALVLMFGALALVPPAAAGLLRWARCPGWSLVGGVAAIAAAQPYAVYYPLLLIGIIVVAVIGKLRGTLSARYEQFELKRMQSMDI